MKILRNTRILLLKQILTIIIGLIITRLSVSLFGIYDFGIITLIGSVLIFSTILNIVLTTASFNFLMKSYSLGNYQALKIDFYSVFFTHILIGLISSFLILIFPVDWIILILNLNSNSSKLVFYIFKISSLSTFFATILVPIQTVFSINSDFSYYAFIDFLRPAVTLLLLPLIDFFPEYKIILYSCLLPVSNLIPFIVGVFFLKKKHSDFFIFNISIEFNRFVYFLKYVRSVFWGTLGYLYQKESLTLILGKYFSSYTVVSFNLSNTLMSMSTLFSKNFILASNPDISSSVILGQEQNTEDHFSFLTRISFLSVLSSGLCIYLFLPDILKFWIGGELPNNILLIFNLTFLVALLESFSASISPMMLASKHMSQYMKLSGGFPIIFFTLIYGFIFNFSIQIEHLFSFIAIYHILAFVFSVYLLARYDDRNFQNMFYKPVSRCLLIGLLCLLAVIIIKHTLILNLYLKNFLIMGICLSVILYVGFSKIERKSLAELFLFRLRFLKF